MAQNRWRAGVVCAAWLILGAALASAVAPSCLLDTEGTVTFPPLTGGAAGTATGGQAGSLPSGGQGGASGGSAGMSAAGGLHRGGSGGTSGAGGAGGSTPPDCEAQGFVCAPAAPEGWSTYHWLREEGWYEGISGESPQCPSGTSERRYADPGEVNCECTCQKCAPARLVCSTTSDDCSDSPRDYTDEVRAAENMCLTVQGSGGGSLSCELEDVPNCDARLRKELGPRWQHVRDVCTQKGDANLGACSDGKICVRSGGNDFPVGICISAAGADAACPEGWPTRYVVYRDEDVVDTRGCTTCRCDSLGTPVECSTTVYVIHDKPSCDNGPSWDVRPAFSCVHAWNAANDGTWSVRLEALPTADGGECLAAGGEPTGDLTAATPRAYCCQ